MAAVVLVAVELSVITGGGPGASPLNAEAYLLGAVLVLPVPHEEREAEAARRVAEERLRIARDLHDTVAHAMATITVQAGSALHVLGDRDERLRGALTAIRGTSKHALREMRATLGQLRQGTPDGDLPVTPG